ncbi:ice-binding family protein [Streptosporangium subroseum]|uniref:ice-binding family protein n=1 Tax=Streptosporangium subroseum TaxID=106412 RepID=UPI00308479FC|nr:ice-binding family protein [Streptosporangium subroseum]
MLATGIVVAAPQTASAVAAPVPLGAATNFAILAGTSVANTGFTIVTGDVGVSPGAAVTGFPPGGIAGTVHAADATAALAKTDLATAYTNAAGQPADATIPAALGGTTRTPGVYASATGAFGITGTLTLNAQGDPNAIFIFKTTAAATPFVAAASSRVVLAGGARACNVFWQVAGSAAVGGNTTFMGNILALNSVTVGTNATVNGRVLTGTGTVALSTNAVVRADCGPTAAAAPAQAAAPAPAEVAAPAAAPAEAATPVEVAAPAPAAAPALAPGAARVTLTSSCGSGTPGGPVVLTATVRTASGAPVPTGQVVFSNGTTVIGSAALNASGQATMTPNLPAGRWQLTAAFQGGSGVGAGTSRAHNLRVGPGSTCWVRDRGRRHHRHHGGANNGSNNNASAFGGGGGGHHRGHRHL